MASVRVPVEGGDALLWAEKSGASDAHTIGAEREERRRREASEVARAQRRARVQRSVLWFAMAVQAILTLTPQLLAAGTMLGGEYRDLKCWECGKMTLKECWSITHWVRLQAVLRRLQTAGLLATILVAALLDLKHATDLKSSSSKVRAKASKLPPSCKATGVCLLATLATGDCLEPLLRGAEPDFVSSVGLLAVFSIAGFLIRRFLLLLRRGLEQHKGPKLASFVNRHLSWGLPIVVCALWYCMQVISITNDVGIYALSDNRHEPHCVTKIYGRTVGAHLFTTELVFGWIYCVYTTGTGLKRFQRRVGSSETDGEDAGRHHRLVEDATVALLILNFSLAIYGLALMQDIHAVYEKGSAFVLLLWAAFTLLWMAIFGSVSLMATSGGRADLKNVLEILELEQHIFISYRQSNGQDQVHAIHNELRTRNMTCWWDMQADQITVESMRDGIKKSLAMLVFLTKGSLSRPFTQLEVRTAIEMNKPIILVHETDNRHGGTTDLSEYIAEAPADLRVIFEGVESVPYRRRKHEAGAMYSLLLRRVMQISLEAMQVASTDVGKNRGPSFFSASLLQRSVLPKPR
eukprot:CAMPEP_0183799108 /NCGR_PEP_ID=MMETSP0803_2-20130417/20721_1 /TAXON_ID=195967 /ORGANISM="Crustomastix stigmata, Strain CCMP3273" /LENGTH=577 /DNA_ID=CAMNT_0026043807 /DNA_START=151 /DNA_END=1880 /DNA_ORIENTATION=-